MNYSEEKFEAFIHLKDVLSIEGDAEINEELHEESIEQFGKEIVQEAIEAWNQEIDEGQNRALKHLREVLGLN